MIRELNLAAWGGIYYLAPGKPSVTDLLEISELLDDIAKLSGDEVLELSIYNLLVDADDDMLDDEMVELINENFPDMLADGTVVVSDYGEYTLKGIPNRKLGVAQHITDCKRYYTDNPFIM